MLLNPIEQVKKYLDTKGENCIYNQFQMTESSEILGLCYTATVFIYQINKNRKQKQSWYDDVLNTIFPKYSVIRNKVYNSVKINELVVGDIILLSEGIPLSKSAH